MRAGKPALIFLNISFPVHRIKRNPGPKSGILFVQSDRSGDLTGTHTPGTNIHMAGGTVDDRLHALHIGLPGTIGTPVRVGNLNAEGNALVAELALCHPLHLLAVAYFRAVFTSTADIITERIEKSKKIFQKNSRNFPGRQQTLPTAKVLRNGGNSYIIKSSFLLKNF